ncbi:MAG: glycosyltransferase family 4 protein [Prosthecobacter sp.]|uniref:glycosyltransferase family 4 protein n=1 Tax=Prosthecobacter sp. TaxID=1965333 RepID=UPI0025F18628|nr:glycosyltransferase family 4 protein [Prosthecobacter sp.]MCF7787326.1 glycosyltransferase family 4 protein [Prosthecobacter sp.]
MQSDTSNASANSVHPSAFYGLIGSGLVGRDPFDRRSFSGISYYFFKECERQGLLLGAAGCELEGWRKWLLLALSYHRQKALWRMRYYLGSRYRDQLTRILASKIPRDQRIGTLLQIGAMFDGGELLQKNAYCTSYHDGNIAMRLRSPFGARGFDKRRAAQALAYERKVAQKMDRVFVMGDYLARSFEEDLGVSPHRIVNISHGANLDEIPTSDPQKNYASLEVLFVAVEFERKGGRVLLPAFQRVRQQLPGAVLHVIGVRGEPPAGLPLENVRWHGFMRKEVPAEAAVIEDLYRRCSVFVLPSFYEPFGISVSEAMLYGIAPIITGDWGVAEKVEPGVSGLHVKAGDEAGLAAALLELLGDPAKASAYGKAARQRGLDHFTWPAVVTSLGHALDAMHQEPSLGSLRQ